MEIAMNTKKKTMYEDNSNSFNENNNLVKMLRGKKRFINICSFFFEWTLFKSDGFI